MKEADEIQRDVTREETHVQVQQPQLIDNLAKVPFVNNAKLLTPQVLMKVKSETDRKSDFLKKLAVDAKKKAKENKLRRISESAGREETGLPVVSEMILTAHDNQGQSAFQRRSIPTSQLVDKRNFMSKFSKSASDMKKIDNGGKIAELHEKIRRKEEEIAMGSKLNVSKEEVQSSEVPDVEMLDSRKQVTDMGWSNQVNK